MTKHTLSRHALPIFLIHNAHGVSTSISTGSIQNSTSTGSLVGITCKKR